MQHRRTRCEREKKSLPSALRAKSNAGGRDVTCSRKTFGAEKWVLFVQRVLLRLGLPPGTLHPVFNLLPRPQLRSSYPITMVLAAGATPPLPNNSLSINGTDSGSSRSPTRPRAPREQPRSIELTFTFVSTEALERFKVRELCEGFPCHRDACEWPKMRALFAAEDACESLRFSCEG